jgi:hypothetical protein
MATNITFHPGERIPPNVNQANKLDPFAIAGFVEQAERFSLLNQKGVTIWLTGLSASGKVSLMGELFHVADRLSKSTIACALEQHLLHLRKFAYRLDGDNVRCGLNNDLGFDEKSRIENIRRIGEVRHPTDFLCSNLARNSSRYRLPNCSRTPPASPLLPSSRLIGQIEMLRAHSTSNQIYPS